MSTNKRELKKLLKKIERQRRKKIRETHKISGYYQKPKRTQVSGGSTGLKQTK